MEANVLTLLLAADLEHLLDQSHGRFDPLLQVAVASQPDDIADMMTFTPVEHPMEAESGVTAEDDAYTRPGLAQAANQQGQDRPGMAGTIDVAGAKIGNQRLIAAEDVQRQEAVAVVVAMEEAPDLAAMDRVVGGIEVEVRSVRHNGEMKWRGQRLYVSEVLAKEPVALRQIDNHLWELRFSFHFLGYLDERTMTISTPRHKR